MLKKLMRILLVTALITAMGTSPICAKSDLDAGENKTHSLLKDNGLPQEIISEMSEETISELERELENDPENVDITTNISYFDNLKEVEALMSHSDEELIEMGLSDKAVDGQKEQIMDMYETEKSELMRDYGLSKVEAKLFYDAVESGLEQQKEGIESEPRNEDVHATGSISSSKLTTSTTKTSAPTKTYKVRYKCTSTISWKSPFFLYGWNDKFAVAWGGELNIVDQKGTAKYWTIKNAKYDKFLKNRTVSSTQTPSKGVVFTLPQGPKAQDKLKSASMTFTLQQKKKEGKETSLVWRYGHRTVKIGGLSVGIGSASISFGSAYDKSKQGEITNLKY